MTPLHTGESFLTQDSADRLSLAELLRLRKELLRLRDAWRASNIAREDEARGTPIVEATPASHSPLPTSSTIARSSLVTSSSVPALGWKTIQNQFVDDKSRGAEPNRVDLVKFVANFPTIKESSRRQIKGKVFGFPVDIKQRGFERLEKTNSFPLEVISHDEVKIKSVPISFHWASNGDTDEDPPVAGGRRQAPNHIVLKGPTHQRP